jgi:hypothetical protein
VVNELREVYLAAVAKLVDVLSRIPAIDAEVDHINLSAPPVRLKTSYNFFAPRHQKNRSAGIQKLEFLILNQKNRSAGLSPESFPSSPAILAA